MSSLFPDGLLDWAGHRDGGVKKPFIIESGRPTGKLIQTRLTKRLQDWVHDLVVGKEGTPNAIFLIGGPGNGKTDTIESTIKILSDSIGKENNLFETCRKKFDIQLPPRKIVIDLTSFVDRASPLFQRHLEIVQDATEGDLKKGDRTPESLFLDDVENLLNLRSNEKMAPLYFCGINRGILAHATIVGEAENRRPEILEFINCLTQAATSGSKAISSWPLDKYVWAVGWPMDVESLVEHQLEMVEPAPVIQILEKALNPNDWTAQCEAGDLCPFHTNRNLLQEAEARYNFSRNLHFYELASGKRWNFRDLFSTVSHVLVGHESNFNIDNHPVTPCAWATYHADSVRKSSSNAVLSAWLLASRLYSHALFPTWPKLTDVTKSIRELNSDEIDLLPYLEQFFDEIANNKNRSSTEIGSLLGKDFCLTLDPANTRRELTLQDNLTVGEVEDAFTNSTRRGLALTSRYLTKIEITLLSLLAEADEACEADDVSPRVSAKVRSVQWNIRALASRFTKRGLAVGTGICRDQLFLEGYHDLLQGTLDSKKFLRKSFQKLINKDHTGLSVPLSTTFGQPPHSMSGQVRLLGKKSVTAKIVSTNEFTSRPRDQLLYLSLDEITVPVTFTLFKALFEVQEGLLTASLPEEIHALVDGTSNVLAGRFVHDESGLEDAQIEIWGSSQKLVVEDGRIVEE